MKGTATTNIARAIGYSAKFLIVALRRTTADTANVVGIGGWGGRRLTWGLGAIRCRVVIGGKLALILVKILIDEIG